MGQKKRQFDGTQLAKAYQAVSHQNMSMARAASVFNPCPAE